MMLGFDYVIGSQLAALSEFQKFFGVQQPDGSWIVPASYLSAWGAIGLGCDVVASWLAAPVLEKYGRKPLILFCAGVSTVAIILQQLATNWRVHLAGRAVNGSSFCQRFIKCVATRFANKRGLQVYPLVLCSPSLHCGLERPAVLSLEGFGSASVSTLGPFIYKARFSD